MTSPAAFAGLAALMGDPARAAMLQALLSGEALTAGELARAAGIGAPAASAHLARLVEGGLVLVHPQGRHRYHRLAGEEVAAAIEMLGGLATAVTPARRWPHGEEFRQARLCYDHLAGRLGVALYGALTGRDWIAPAAGGWQATEVGESGLAALGVDLAAARRARRFACDCMDWSERRAHLAGGLGREIAACCLRRHWLRRLPPLREGDPLARRRLALTPEGARQLDAALGVRLVA
ncbi:winged helix-turn-helix domain-containing protein [Siccirubricoccus sp. KC 17139]|uniref:Winged helix-turn-helix domain-containing protein n=1 Tax=Siccirubricoccus soli TaxID=2899147 RepID=A0ABT1D4U0_9PROT|nr:winged helix-turn-helix domain-containing protein [Siccirubricoccus soli]MCO6416943.1 winged helix-turn-helix domain-containing protein [Siccirubricoccus soli]MCP2683078.1 winged helix-turn-helix domain-containing protein [Siccirubricoccus soli]